MFVTVVYAETEGTYGGNIEWIFDSTTNTLTIFGEGDMRFFNSAFTWDNNNYDITNVVINEGVTSISSSAFNICTNIKAISIPKSIMKISENAFENCIRLEKVYYSGTKADWNKINIEKSGNDYFINANIRYAEETHICVFGDWAVITQPTCVETGKKIRECSCGNEETEIISPTGIHKYEWVIQQEATCTENGKKVKCCTVCGVADDSMVINKLGHETGDWEISLETSCEKQGERIQKCLNCGAVLNQASIAKLPHNFGEWKISVKPTVNEYGIEKRSCKSCKYIETRQIDKLPGTSADNNLLGDVNGDNAVKATDARLILQVVAGLKTNDDIIILNSDLNNDGRITATDARIILQIVAGINSK